MITVTFEQFDQYWTLPIFVVGWLAGQAGKETIASRQKCGVTMRLYKSEHNGTKQDKSLNGDMYHHTSMIVNITRRDIRDNNQ